MVINQIAGPLVLFLLMMIVGLELTVADFRRVLAMPRTVVVGTLAQWTLLPLMTWLVVTAIGVTPAFGAGAILVAVAPGAGVSNILAAVARANTALSVTLTAATSVFAVVALPTIASLGMRVFLHDAAHVEVPVATLVLQLALSLLLPIAVGMFLRARHAERARRIAPLLHRTTFVLVLVVVGFGIALAPDEQVDFEGSGRALVAAGVWTLCAMAIGWAVASALRLSRADRFTFLIEFSARNIAVSTIVAMSGLGRVDLTFFSGVYVFVGYPLVFIATWWRRRRVGAEIPVGEPGR